MNKLLATDGSGSFYETEYTVPDLTPSEIRVRSIMTGVCRSDIDMMQGTFGPLPLNMQGHEGLGEVIEIGPDVTDVKIGDYVATRGEPAYADIYNVRHHEYVKVEEAHPRYILEPVACGINLIEQDLYLFKTREGNDKRLLILGSGFLAWVAYHTIKAHHLNFDITVCGNSNKELWGEILTPSYTGTFDVIIDLSNKLDIFQLPIVNETSLIILGTQKQVSTDFSQLLWKACTIVFPSPRQKNFYKCMSSAEEYVRTGKIVVDSFWSRSYNRNMEWQNAFSDGVTRPINYSRGYITWV